MRRRGRGRGRRYVRSNLLIDGEVPPGAEGANFPPGGAEIYSLQEDGVTPTTFDNAIEADGNVIGGLFPRFIDENTDVFQFAPSITPDNSNPIDTTTGARIEYKASRSIEDLSDYTVFYVEDEDGDISNGFQVNGADIDVDKAQNDLDYILGEDILEQTSLRSVTTEGFFEPIVGIFPIDISLDTAFDDSVSVETGQSVTIDVLENDLDVDDNGFELSVGLNTIGGATLEIVDQKVLYTPNANARGNDIFTYNLLQDGEVIDTATVTVETFTPIDPVDPDVSFEPVFGTPEEDIIEVEGNNQLVFAGDSNDLIDAFTGEGSNRIYAGNDDDTLILGANDRAFGGDGSDRFFVTVGGDNTITGGKGADQFWIATAEVPDAANVFTDFTISEDIIGIAGLGIEFADVTLTQQGNDALIASNGNDLALLEDINITDLSEIDFTFV